jgi:hypothetical protein
VYHNGVAAIADFNSGPVRSIGNLPGELSLAVEPVQSAAVILRSRNPGSLSGVGEGYRKQAHEKRHPEQSVRKIFHRFLLIG